MRLWAAMLLVLATVTGPGCGNSEKGEPESLRFEATAHSVEGITAAGVRSREGIVAADPEVLPLGARIRVTDAGPYSGVYVVADTGAKVDGRHIDLYLRSEAEARKFGRKTVTVEILERPAPASQ